MTRRDALSKHCMTEAAKLQGQGWQNNYQKFPSNIGKRPQGAGVGSEFTVQRTSPDSQISARQDGRL